MNRTIKNSILHLIQRFGFWLAALANRQPQTMTEVFGEKGLFAESETFEFREPQLAIADAVFAALNRQRHLLAEAGTGTGKTLAYLVPAILHARKTGLPVVISTGTKQLQDQIGDKDIPFLRRMLPFKFDSVVLKGASNYACLQKIRDARRRKETNVLSELETNLLKSAAGEWNQLNYEGNDAPRLSVSRARCASCHLQTSCPFVKLINQAKTADVVITNHHNWLANEKAGTQQNIPPHEAIIFDEAHLLENIATNIFTNSLAMPDFTFIRQAAKNAQVTELHQTVFALEETMLRFNALLYIKTTKRSTIYDRLEEIRTDLMDFAEQIGKLDSRRRRGLPGQMDFLLRKISLILDARRNDDYILARNTDENGFILQSIPVETHLHLHRIFERKASAIFISATLSANGSFDYSHYFLGLEKDKTDEIQSGSPFDYASQGMLYLPDTPDPRSAQYMPRAIAEIVKLTDLCEGRTFVLCTSKANAAKLCEAVREKTSYPCLLQGQDDLPTNELIHLFKETPHAILFGTSTFWQGVDVQGSQLSCVIIDRLPFAVPTDTAFIARAAKLKAKGKHPFFNYSLPQAVIQLNQGVGRLLRSVKDSGIVCILDSRAGQSKYSDFILNNLPQFTRSNNLGDAAKFVRDKTDTTVTVTFAAQPESDASFNPATDNEGNLMF